MNQDKDVSTAPTCTICNEVILMVVEIWGKTKCCREPVHVACFRKTLGDQLLRGVTDEKLYCELCHSLCYLSPLVAKLSQD